MEFSFMHMADIHIDTPFHSRDAGLRNLLKDSIRDAFKNGVDIAISKSLNAVLIAGDAFDNDTLSFASEKFLQKEFERLQKSNISVYYAPGNHDPYNTSYRMNQIEWPENVHIFKSSKPEIVPVVREGQTSAVIVGAAHTRKNETQNIARSFPMADGPVPFIGLLHTFVSGTSCEDEHEKYAPCSIRDLTDKKYAYWALGHIHKRSELCREPYIIYPGNIQGRNPKETCEKGAYIVNIENGMVKDASFINLSPCRWLDVIISGLSAADNLQSLIDKISCCINERIRIENFDGKYLIRAELIGSCPLYRELRSQENIDTLNEEIKEKLSTDYLEIKTDGLYRQIEPEKYINQPHVLGKTLKIIDELKLDDEKLIKLKPEFLSGCNSPHREGVIKYLRGLLNGMDMEAADRLLKENSNED